MASCLKDAIDNVLTGVRGIPYAWDISRSRPTMLFQKAGLWNDQVRREQNGSGYTFEKPACFLELQHMETNSLLEGVTISDYTWRFHIVDEELDAGGGDMDQNTTVIAYHDLLKKALSGYQPPNCSSLFNTDEQPDYDHNDVYHYIVDFKSSFTDTKGSSLDPDQSIYVYKQPPTNLELTSEFADRPVPVDPVISYIWKVCKIRAQVVDTPDPSIKQLLDNGALIPVQYALNNDGTLTIPCLTTTPGIAVLTPFLIDNGTIEDEPYSDGTFDNSANGGFFVGNNIFFNASLPMI